MENKINIKRISSREVSERYKMISTRLENKFAKIKPSIDYFVQKHEDNRAVSKTHAFEVLVKHGDNITTFLKSTKKVYAALYAVYMYDKFGDKSLLNRTYRIEKYISIAREILKKDIEHFIRMHKKTELANEAIFQELANTTLSANNFGDVKKVFNELKEALIGVGNKKVSDIQFTAEELGRSIKNSKIMTHKHNESRLFIMKCLVGLAGEEEIEQKIKLEKISQEAVNFINKTKANLSSLMNRDINLSNAVSEVVEYIRTHKLQNYRDKPRPGNVKFQALVNALNTHNINLESEPCCFIKITKAGRKPDILKKANEKADIVLKPNTKSQIKSSNASNSNVANL